MELWPAFGTLLSVVTGGLALPAEGGRGPHERIDRAVEGYAVEGDGFFVWDEDRHRAEGWAMELAGPAIPPRRA